MLKVEFSDVQQEELLVEAAGDVVVTEYLTL
jgi:hypothetical protein